MGAFSHITLTKRTMCLSRSLFLSFLPCGGRTFLRDDSIPPRVENKARVENVGVDGLEDRLLLQGFQYLPKLLHRVCPHYTDGMVGEIAEGPQVDRVWGISLQEERTDLAFIRRSLEMQMEDGHDVV